MSDPKSASSVLGKRKADAAGLEDTGAAAASRPRPASEDTSMQVHESNGDLIEDAQRIHGLSGPRFPPIGFQKPSSAPPCASPEFKKAADGPHTPVTYHRLTIAKTTLGAPFLFAGGKSVSMKALASSHEDHPVDTSEEKKIISDRLREALQLRRQFVFQHCKRDTTRYDVLVAPAYVPPAPGLGSSSGSGSGSAAKTSAGAEAAAAERKHKYGFKMTHEGVMVAWEIGGSGGGTGAGSDAGAGGDSKERKGAAGSGSGSGKEAASQASPAASSSATSSAATASSIASVAPSSATAVFSAPDRQTFHQALLRLVALNSDGPCKTFSHNRLHILEARFKLHELLNSEWEHKQQKAVPHRDFYNVRKIDNHVHHSACMNQKHLLRFIKHKMKQPEASKDIVIIRDGKPMSLTQVFESLNLTPYDLSVDTLDMHAHKTFHRFDKFNLKYNPVGESRLREIFLKYNNHTKGRFIAELTRQVIDDLESNKYQFCEYRLSIYGREAKEWAALADWVVDNKLFSHNVRWMIQIPRLYAEYAQAKLISSFQTMLDNIFQPLFEVSVDASVNPKLAAFLEQVVGFDCVDDESLREKEFKQTDPVPREWTSANNPAYSMFSYYIYANLLVLNKLRANQGKSTFAFRPHAGEAGDVDHVCCAFLLANSINHGLTLQKNPTIQYLYYLAQIGISMSPLSNNLLFLEYEKNPFPRFFNRGLNVTLSTDDPLMIHVTKEPLMEEYSVAAQVWKLTPIDMCEIARNSVLQSGFEHRYKAHWLGNDYWLRGLAGNDIRQTNVPDIRVEFRWSLLSEELAFLSSHSSAPVGPEIVDPL